MRQALSLDCNKIGTLCKDVHSPSFKDESDGKRFLDQARNDSQRAWILSCGGEGAYWLTAWHRYITLSNQQTRALLRVRVGLPPVSSDDPTALASDPAGICSHCKPFKPGRPRPDKGKLTNNFLHSLICNDNAPGGATGDRSTRSAFVCLTLTGAMNRVMGRPDVPIVNPHKVSLRQPLLSDFFARNPNYTGPDEFANKRADISYTPPYRLLHFGSPTIVFDVVITHPNFPTTSKTPGAPYVAGIAAAKAHERKLREYNKYFIISPADSFVPLSFETGGRFHPKARRALQNLVTGLVGGDPKDWTPSEQRFYNSTLRDLLDSTSLALAKSVAQTLLRRPSPMVDGSGRVLTGDDVAAS